MSPKKKKWKFSVKCHTCGQKFESNAAEKARESDGWLVECDDCTDPWNRGEYGMWECRDCGEMAMSCDCAAGPRYCAAQGCTSPRGDLDDEGMCEHCDDAAVLLKSNAHLCAKHGNYQRRTL